MERIIHPISSHEDILAERDAAVQTPPVQPVAQAMPIETQPDPLNFIPLAQSQTADPVSQSATPRDISSVYPTATNRLPGASTPRSSAAYEKGPNLQQEQPKLPVGVYIIVGLSLLSAASELGLSNGNSIAIFVGIVDAIFAFGLLMRSDLARKVYVGLGMFVIILSVVNIIMTVNLRQRVHMLSQNSHAALQRAEENTGRSAPQSIKSSIAASDAQLVQLDKAYKALYIRAGIEIAVMICVVVYLTRPKAKAAFQ